MIEKKAWWWFSSALKVFRVSSEPNKPEGTDNAGLRGENHGHRPPSTNMKENSIPRCLKA
jgi:hypothetical protein